MEKFKEFQTEQRIKKLLYTFIKQDIFLKNYSSSDPSSFSCQIRQYKPKAKKRTGYDPTKNSFEYDLSLDLNLDTMFSNGIDVQINDQNLQTFNEEFKGNILGVFGKSNKGKTFLLSKIFNLCKHYKKRLTEHTSDIAMKLIVEDQIMLCDSRGTGIALDKDHTDDNNIKLNIIREQFPMFFITELCGIIIYIMGELNQNEMKYYDILKRYKNKQLIIIHNLKEIETLTEVDDYVNNSLKKIFDLNEFPFVSSDSKGRYFKGRDVFYVEKDNKNFVHLICGNWNSDELEEMNMNVTSFINNFVKTNLNRRNVNLNDFIQTFIQQYIKKFFKREINIHQSEYEISQSSSTTKKSNVPVNIQMDLKQGKIYIDPNNEVNFVPKQIVENFISHSKIYECSSYRIYKAQEEEQEKLYVEVDLLGNIQEIQLINSEQNGNYNLRLEGKSANFKEDTNDFLLIQGNYELFLVEIKFKLDEDKKKIVNLNNYKLEYFNGYIRIEFLLEKTKESYVENY